MDFCKASLCPKEANRALLNDSSCWTIIGTESVELSFSSSLACTLEPVTPVPLISTLEVNLQGQGCSLPVCLSALGMGRLWREGRRLLLTTPTPTTPS